MGRKNGVGKAVPCLMAPALAAVVFPASTSAQELALQTRYFPSSQQVELRVRQNLFRTADGAAGLRGAYFDNKKLEGEPVLVRADEAVHFEYRGNGGTPPDDRFGEEFSARWRGTFGPVPASGVYRFGVKSGDAVRLWVGGKKVVDAWSPHLPRKDTGRVELEAGQRPEVRLELWERGGRTLCELGWQFLGSGDPRQPATAVVEGTEGESFAEHEIQWSAAGSRHMLETGQLPEGAYRVRVKPRKGKAAVSEVFRHKDFVWEGDALGTTDRVPAPFERIRVEDGTARVVMRRHTRTPLGLWAQVEAKGQDRGAPFRKLLAGPMRLVTASGERLEGERVETEVSDKRLLDRGRAAHPAVRVGTSVETAYDGCARVELTLEPGTERKRLEGLTLEIPFRQKRAKLWHAVGNGIRGNPAGALPDGHGRIWDSREGPRGSFATDSFVPYLWVGGPSRGLCFFADHARNWAVAEGKPCLSLHRRADGDVVLRVHLVQKPVTLKEKRTITFGLMASPGKPMPENWRRWLFEHQWRAAGEVPGYETVGWMGTTRWGAAQRRRETYPLGRDFSVLSKMQEMRLTGKLGSWRPFLKAWSERHLSDDEPRGGYSKKKIRKLTRISIRTPGRLQPDRYTAYWEEFYSVSRAHPATRIYRDEWDAGYGKVRFRPGGASYLNFQCWYGAEFIRRGIGLYFDNTYPKLGYNPVTTTAYRDADGTIHPSARMWWTRRYFRRIWNLHRQLGPAATKPVMMHHMTNGHIVPQLTYGHTNLDLEWRGSKKAFQKRFAPDLLRAESLGLKSGNVPFALANERGATVTRFGGLMVHEVRAFFTHERAKRMMETLLRFGYGRGAESVNYWDEDAELTVNDERCKWLLLKKEGRRMLLLCTWNPGKRRVRVEASGAVRELKDAESGNGLEANGTGFEVTMPGYGVRLLRWRKGDAGA